MAALEEPKRPVSGYFLFVNATREKIQVELGKKDFGAVTKLQAERWKTMPAGEKAKYEKEAAALKAKYEKDIAAFKEAGGVVGQKRAAKKDAKAAKADKAAKKAENADKPKRPAGGAFGVYLSQNRAKFMESLPKGSPCTAVTKVASEKWKAMAEETKAPFEKQYQELKAKYEEDVKAWAAAKGVAAAAGEEDNDVEEVESGASPEKPKADAAPKKRGRPSNGSESAPKKAKGKGKGAEPEGPAIDPKVLEQAVGLKLDGPLKNLASRPEMASISHDKILAALNQSGGLVNKAKASLLGA